VPGALVRSTAPAGSSVGAVSRSIVGVGAGEILIGSMAEAEGGASFGSTAAAGSSAGTLSCSIVGAGAGEILTGSMAEAVGGVSFGPTVVAGSSGAFVSCAGRGRGSGGDDAIRWRCVAVRVTWCNHVTTLRAIPEKGDAVGVGGCGSCAGADAAANSWKARQNVAGPNTFDLTALSHSTRQTSVCCRGFSRIGAVLRPKKVATPTSIPTSGRYLAELTWRYGGEAGRGPSGQTEPNS